MGKPQRKNRGISEGIATKSIAQPQCPDMPKCRRWSDNDGGLHCRLCWRDFAHPKVAHLSERRA